MLNAYIILSYDNINKIVHTKKNKFFSIDIFSVDGPEIDHVSKKVNQKHFKLKTGCKPKKFESYLEFKLTYVWVWVILSITKCWVP